MGRYWEVLLSNNKGCVLHSDAVVWHMVMSVNDDVRIRRR